MTVLFGVVAAAILFGLFTMLRPGDSGCTGHCAGCTRDGACAKDGARR
ncbi:MAG TPA: hypothetical protein VFS05_03865 [Gemmatimonadaceae bacterium]|nr:hypothetical protein [Gemmatimonadaceae bacterium]